MLNDGYAPSKIDPLRSGVVLGAQGWSAMLPSLVSASQAVDRLARLEKAQSASLSADGMDSMRLERAAYLLVVSIDRLVRAIAALGWRIVLFLARRSATAERRSVRADETRA